MAGSEKAKQVGVWVLTVLIAALFLMAGGSKLAGAEQHVKGFAHWAYPDWFRLVVGAVEVVSAVVLLIPRVAFFGAAALAVVMIGATFTHLFRATGEGSMAVFTLVLFAFTALLAWARRPASSRGRSPGVAGETGR